MVTKDLDKNRFFLVFLVFIVIERHQIRYESHISKFDNNRGICLKWREFLIEKISIYDIIFINNVVIQDFRKKDYLH